ncbi:MAG TPA: hypothetical protein VMF31_09500 [Solirubrobacterales bacterium]|nr:hypothetical protein [Solirubrobacterales bacterium]
MKTATDENITHSVPKGSYEAGDRVRLPEGAEGPFVVFVNGIDQDPDTAYSVVGDEIVFSRQILKEKVSPGRWLAMSLGLFGTYYKNETIDVQFFRDGQIELAPDLEVR